jgi:hypothetical protein
MKKNIFILIIVLIILAAGLGTYSYLKNNAQSQIPETNDQTETDTNTQNPDQPQNVERAMPIEDYVRLNISELSPEKEVLGGTYYVTKIEAHGGAGTVEYEDGHNAYVADFTYSTDERGAITMNSFVIRK